MWNILSWFSRPPPAVNNQALRDTIREIVIEEMDHRVRKVLSNHAQNMVNALGGKSAK